MPHWYMDAYWKGTIVLSIEAPPLLSKAQPYPEPAMKYIASLG